MKINAIDFSLIVDILQYPLINILTKKGFQVIFILIVNVKNFADKNNLDKSSKKYAYNNDNNIIIQQYLIKKNYILLQFL